MSITQHLTFARTALATLLAATLIAGITGCSSDSSSPNPNIKTSDSYKIEYIPGAMDAAMGKTQFQISVTDRTTKDAITGEMVTLMPMMYMADNTHSTPVDGACTESSTAGTYNCTVFYVMADVDATGASIGDWELTVMIGGMSGESVIFAPSVGMAMGGTAMVKLKNSNLTMMSMEGPVARTFQIFKSSLTGVTDNHTFEMFTSTMETMMSFPAVDTSVTLNTGTINELPITSMSVAVSTTPTFDVTYDASEDSNGYWTATGITGLTDGTETELYVRVIINTNTLNNSIDGVFVDEATTPSYATFTVTPSAPM